MRQDPAVLLDSLSIWASVRLFGSHLLLPSTRLAVCHRYRNDGAVGVASRANMSHQLSGAFERGSRMEHKEQPLRSIVIDSLP